MGSKYVKRDEVDTRGMSPEQLAILIVMLGFIIIAVGMYITKEVLNIFFEIGIVICIFGTSLYALMIYARIYSLEHLPIPLPDTVKDFLTHGTFRQPTNREPAPIKHEPRVAMISRTTPTYEQSATPTNQTVAVSPQGSSWAGPSPFSSTDTPSTGTSGQPSSVSPAIPPTPVAPPSPGILPVPSEQPVVEKPKIPAPAAHPEPKKEKYVDVLEEADKEFESYIDKLIEE